MDSDTDRKQPAHRVRRSLAALGAFAVLVSMLLVLLGWLLHSEGGARVVLSTLTTSSAGALRADGIHGRISGPLLIEHLVLERPNQRLTLDNVRLEWEPAALLNSRLHITSLQVGRLTISSKIEQKPEPAKLPDSISLPLALHLDKVQIDAGEIGWGPVNLIKLGAFAFNLDFDRHRYRLQLDRLGARSASGADSITGNLSGLATLGVSKPYALHAELTSGGTAVIQNQNVGANGRINLNGSLAEFAADIDLAIKQARIHGRAILQPFSTQALAHANVTAQSLDLSALHADLPHTDLDGSLSATGSGTGQLALTNRNAGLYSDGKLPLGDLQLVFRQVGGVFIFDKIGARLGAQKQAAGALSGSGRYASGALTLALAVDALDLHGLDQHLQATRLSGDIGIQHATGRQEIMIDLHEPIGKRNVALTAHATLADARLAIERAELRLGGGRINAAGHIDLADQQTFRAEGEVSRFHLQDLGQFAQFPALDLNGKFNLHGSRQPRLSADLVFHISDSRLAGHMLQGDGQMQLRADRILVPKLQLTAGDNRLDMHGELSQGNAQLSFALAAPKLEQLGAGFGGALQASGNARGSFTQPHINLTWSGDKLRLPEQLQADSLQGKAAFVIGRDKPFFMNAATVDASGRGLKSASQQLSSFDAHLRFAPQANAPLMMTLRAEGMTTPQLRTDLIDATVQGTTAQHTLNASVAEAGQHQQWAIAATGGLAHLDRGAVWQGSITRFDAAGRFVAHLAEPAAFSMSQQRVQLDQFRLHANTADITVEQFTRDARSITTRGRVEHLQLAQILKFTNPQPAMATDLQLNGDWDVTIADTITGRINIKRQSGDVVMHGGAPVALGLRTLDASAIAANGQLNVRFNADGQQLGHIDISARTSTAGGGNRLGWSAEAPVFGSAHIDIPSLAWAGPLVSPSAITEGRLQSSVSLSGTVSEPTFTGQIAGSGLRIFYGDIGLDLRQGVLDSEFRGDTLDVKSLAFQSNGGSVVASGPISFSDGKPSMQASLKAERFTLLNRSDRRLVVSGSSQLAWREGRVNLIGAFDIDAGFFDIGREDMPQLSDDVVIIGRDKKTTGRMVAAVDLKLNLANGVALKGHGLDALLQGQIHLTSEPNQLLKAQGSVQIAQGTYTAYGRKLAIEQGVLRFNGALNNPALDIVAMRRGQEVEAGVAVRGTVLAPRVTLVSEPSAPEAEKLSWLVLGRALDTAGSGDLGALQSAASALLSQGAATGVQSQIATAFGLDDFRIASAQDNVQQRVITLGKRLSSRLYVSYEQSLQAATSVLLLRYTLTPRLTLEAEAGTRSALSLFYNVAFD